MKNVQYYGACKHHLRKNSLNNNMYHEDVSVEY